MVKIILVIGIILMGMRVMGQNHETNSEMITDDSNYQQIKSLKELTQRLGKNHEESIKANNMLQLLKKEVSDAEQKQMSETLSTIEYDRWKTKQTQVQNVTAIKAEEKN